MLRPAALGPAGQGLRGPRRQVHRPRQLRFVLLDAGALPVGAEQPAGRVGHHRDRRAAGLPLRLCADAHRAADALAVPGHLADPDLRAFAAAGPGADLPVRHAGLLQGAAGRRFDLRRRRHRDRAGLLLLPARHADPDDRAGHRRCAPLRGGRRAGRLQAPRLLHRDPAGRQVRPDQRRAGRVHPGDDRFRHRQGDRRQLQRAGDRRLQEGDRPAGFLDGRGRRHGAAGAGGARLPGRPAGAEEAGRAADRAGRAAGAAAQVRTRPFLHPVLPAGVGGHPRHSRHGDLGLADQILAVQSQPHARQLRLRQVRLQRLGFLLELGADGGGRGGVRHRC